MGRQAGFIILVVELELTTVDGGGWIEWLYIITLAQYRVAIANEPCSTVHSRYKSIPSCALCTVLYEYNRLIMKSMIL